MQMLTLQDDQNEKKKKKKYPKNKCFINPRYDCIKDQLKTPGVKYKLINLRFIHIHMQYQECYSDFYALESSFHT